MEILFRVVCLRVNVTGIVMFQFAYSYFYTVIFMFHHPYMDVYFNLPILKNYPYAYKKSVFYLYIYVDNFFGKTHSKAHIINYMNSTHHLRFNKSTITIRQNYFRYIELGRQNLCSQQLPKSILKQVLIFTSNFYARMKYNGKITSHVKQNNTLRKLNSTMKNRGFIHSFLLRFLT